MASIGGNKRVETLDSLKGLAVIGIFGIHVGVNHSIFTGYLSALFMHGNLGVEITYIINALLLASQYYKHFGENKNSLKLVFRSILNILPIYYLFILTLKHIYTDGLGLVVPNGAVSTSLLFVNVFSSDYANFFGGSLYFSCLVVGWFLYSFYLRYINNLKKSIICGLVIEALAIWIIPEIFANTLDYAHFQPVSYMCRCIGSFIIGHMIYFIVSTEEYNKIQISQHVKIAVTGYLLFVILFNRYTSSEFYFIISLLLIINYKKPVFLLNNPILTYLGKRTITIFCWHILVYSFMDKYMNADYLYLLVVIVLTLLLSEITYRVDNIRRKWLKSLPAYKKYLC